MEYRKLGQTGIRVSAISFGAGPVSQLLTSDDTQRQLATVVAAIEAGVNWFDTAAAYDPLASFLEIPANLWRASTIFRLNHSRPGDSTTGPVTTLPR
jgi:predicted aldo/keto reductase-like oxidoreductase